MNKVLILGPIWRNQNIINFIEKRGFDVHFTNSKLTKNFVVINKIDMIVTSGYPSLYRLTLFRNLLLSINSSLILLNTLSFITG
jgi:hypothetical protein